MIKKGGKDLPRKPKTVCRYPGCEELTESRYCEEHTKQVHRQYNKFKRPPDTYKRYNGKWRSIRKRYIATHPLCEKCKEDNRLTPASEVHHIIPLSQGGTNEEDNLMSLCKSCHSKITAKESFK